jgi:predicted cobalt transporter CbtA
MPFRLLAAAFMAALLATLGLMFARVATMPVNQLNVTEGDFLLLHHLGLGFCGSLALQFVFLHRPPGIYRGLGWGAAGYVALTLMPWLVLPDALPGQVSPGEPLLWLFVAAASAGGLWLLWRPGDPGKPRLLRRLGGLALLLLPLLASAMGGSPLSPADPLEGSDPDFGVWRGLALNLLFWLLLGLFSVLSARRVVQRPSAGGGGASGAETGSGPDPDRP